MSPLPAERDLPTERHLQLRNQLIRGITARPAGRSRWTVPVAAAVTAAAVLGAAVTVDALRSADPTSATGASQPTTTPGPPSSTAPPGPSPIPGVPPATVAAVVEHCGPKVEKVDVPLAPGTKLALLNLVDDEFGRLAVVASGQRLLLCRLDTVLPDARAAQPLPEVTNKISGGFDIDHWVGLVGVAGGGYFPVVGRVGPEVTRVTATIAGLTAEATIHNGTFLCRVSFPPSMNMYERDDISLEVHAYDAAGNELPDDGEVHPWP